MQLETFISENKLRLIHGILLLSTKMSITFLGRWDLLSPIAWKGQFQIKKKLAGIGLGLETVVDHNLWFWHSTFGFHGRLNSIKYGIPHYLNQ
jgi:hypothetical protein